MNSGPKIVAELRNWTKQLVERDTFQGYVFNDIRHQYSDGHFLTLEADEVAPNKDGYLVYVGASIYLLWNAHKNKSQKGLFDED